MRGNVSVKRAILVSVLLVMVVGAFFAFDLVSAVISHVLAQAHGAGGILGAQATPKGGSIGTPMGLPRIRLR